MRYNSFLLAAILIGCTTIAGCATIVTGTSTDVSIASEPPDADIEVNGSDRGTTPATLSLDSGRSHSLEISLDGYETETIQIQKGTSGWVAGNILFGGIPGFIIDAATGGMYVLSPKQANATLDEQTASNGTVHIRVAMNVDKDLPKIGELTPESQGR